MSQLSPRVSKLRNHLLDLKPTLSIERAKIITEVYKNNLSLPPKLLRSLCFYEVCRQLPLCIEEDELIVGHPAGGGRAGVFSPDICWQWVERELDTIHARPQDPYIIKESDKEILRNEIFPFWKGRSVEERIFAEMQLAEIAQITYKSGIIDCEVKTTSGGGDLAPGYENILFRYGFHGIKERALERLKELSFERPDDIDQIYTLRSMVQVCEGMILLGKRYAGLALDMAERTGNRDRQFELREIAHVCQNVPANPPQNFYEALQMIWFGQVAFYIEENTSGTSPGRVDQYLYPFFKQDQIKGILHEEKAKELLSCFLIKFNSIPWPLSEFGCYYFAGYIPFMNIVVGGQDREGNDAVNPLSLMILDCVGELKMYQPSLSARLHKKTSDTFYEKILDLLQKGLGFPALHFDETTINMLMLSGIPEEEARNYCLMGCVEPYIPGKMSRWTSATYTNFPIAVELALFEGRHLQTNELLGVSTKAPHQWKTFADCLEAVKLQLKHIIKTAVSATLVAQRSHRDLLPKPLSSCMVEGHLENGKDLMEGGAVYNRGPGVVMVGVADYANSLMAIKKLIFDEKRLTWDQFLTAIRDNFEGHELIRMMCLQVAKYGNDCDEVDLLAKEVIQFASEELSHYRGLYAPMELGTLSITTNIAQGKVISALPSGRRAFAPLADGISPSQGTDTLGPTAVIQSVDKIDQRYTSIGTLLNMKLHPQMLENQEGRRNLIALLKAHLHLGGAQLQMNCITQETLLLAQQRPEDYRSLIVRVSGYSAFFTELSKEVQDDIIARSQQKAWN